MTPSTVPDPIIRIVVVIVSFDERSVKVVMLLLVLLFCKSEVTFGVTLSTRCRRKVLEGCAKGHPDSAISNFRSEGLVSKDTPLLFKVWPTAKREYRIDSLGRERECGGATIYEKYLSTSRKLRCRECELLVVGCIDSCGDSVIEQRKSARGYHGLVAVQFFDDLRLDEQLFLSGIDVGRHGV